MYRKNKKSAELLIETKIEVHKDETTNSMIESLLQKGEQDSLFGANAKPKEIKSKNTNSKDATPMKNEHAGQDSMPTV